MIIKLDVKTSKELREQIIADISKNEIRSIFHKEINKFVDEKVGNALKSLSDYNNLHNLIRNSIDKHVKNNINAVIRDNKLEVEKVTADMVIDKINISQIEKKAVGEVKKKVLANIGK